MVKPSRVLSTAFRRAGQRRGRSAGQVQALTQNLRAFFQRRLAGLHQQAHQLRAALRVRQVSLQ